MDELKNKKISIKEFDLLFDKLKNWGKWGKDDERGTLNYITPEKIIAASKLVKSGRKVSMAIPINKNPGPDNPNPGLHYMVNTHDIDIGSKDVGFAMDFLGIQFHGDCHSSYRCIVPHLI